MYGGHSLHQEECQWLIYEQFSKFVIGVVDQRTSTIPASFVISFHGMMILMNFVKISSILTIPQQSSAISVEGIVGALDSKRIHQDE